MKKKLTFFYLTFIGLIGCAKLSYDSTDEMLLPQINSSRFRSEAECITEAQSLWKDVYGSNTKSGKVFPNIKSTSLISSPKTKSNNSIPDSVAFLINFDKEQGFALIRTDRATSPIIALTDYGNLDVAKLADNSFTFMDDGEKIMYGLLRQELFTPKETSIERSSYITQSDSSHISSGEWYTDASVGPLVYLKWGQAYPFNKLMPVSQYSEFGPDTPYKGRLPVGCTMIATAQVMVTTQHPSTFSTMLSSFALSDMSNISTFVNWPYYTWNKYDIAITDSLQRMETTGAAAILSAMANRINATYSKSGTGAWPEDAMEMLIEEDSSFYGTPHCSYYDAMDDYSYSLLCSFISSGRPLLTWGWTQREYNEWGDIVIRQGPGHTWVMDGFLNRHRHNQTGQIESQRLVHFNWGWQGRCDGYYDIGIVDVSQRIMRHAPIDSNNGSLVNYDFCYYAAFYLYGYPFI